METIKLICISSSVLLAIGLFWLACGLWSIPKVRTSKVYLSLAKRQKKKKGTLGILYNDLSIWLSKLIRINKCKRMDLQSDLQAAGMEITPELFLAKALLKAVLVGLLIIPALFLMPLLSPLVAAISILLYFKETRTVRERINQFRTAIDTELPRLVFTAEETFKNNRDVLSFLERYVENAGPELRRQLRICVADMRSGNYEAAIMRLESRVGSAMMSDVCRGLIGVLRGDDTHLYWATLNIKFADYQRQQLRRAALKVPAKVHRLSFVLLGCFLLVYLVVIVTQVMGSLSTMFG